MKKQRTPVTALHKRELRILELIQLYNLFCEKYGQRGVEIPVVYQYRANRLWKTFVQADVIINELGASPWTYLESQFEAFRDGGWLLFWQRNPKLGPMQLISPQARKRYLEFYERRVHQWGKEFEERNDDLWVRCQIQASSYLFHQLWIGKGGTWEQRQEVLLQFWPSFSSVWLAADPIANGLRIQGHDELDWAGFDAEGEKLAIGWYYKFVVETKSDIDAKMFARWTAWFGVRNNRGAEGDTVTVVKEVTYA